MRKRALSRGLTLLEVMISLAILAIIASLIYGAFDGMAQSKKALSRVNERYHQGRSALTRMSREIEAAFLTLHQPPSLQLHARETGFMGHDSGSRDRVDFNSFSHRRLKADTHESDQNEISYFTSNDPNQGNKLDLVRRESTALDLDFDKGGVVNVICEDIDSFDIQYLDPQTGEWADSWEAKRDSLQYRLPLQVKITLVLNNGPGGRQIHLSTKTALGMQAPLQFAN